MLKEVVSPETIAYLLSWAVFYTGYPMPAQLPIIEFVPHSYFVRRICYNLDTPESPCIIQGMYDDNIDGVIFLDEVFKDKINGFTKSIIVHEMVHYLQDMTGDWKEIKKWQHDIRCQERRYRQREAYMAQDKYMLDVYGKKRSLPRRYSPCGNY